jgi:hypothetical protein
VSRGSPDRTLQALTRVAGAGVGCDFWLGPEFGLKIGWLSRLGLVRSYRQRVPRCVDHGCHLAGICPHQRRFDVERRGIAGLKGELTRLGQQVARGEVPLEDILLADPAVRALLERLAARPTSQFVIRRWLLEAAWSGADPLAALTPPEAGWLLRLLTDLGYLTCEEDRVGLRH